MYAVGNSEAIRDANLMYSNPFKQSSDVESVGYREYFTADLNPSIPATRLARYRSAPSSSIVSLLEGGFADLLTGGDAVPYDLQLPAAVKQEMAAEQESQGRYSAFQEAVGGVYEDTSSLRSNRVQVEVQGKMSGLARQSSSPAGFFSNLTVDNGFPFMGDMGNYRAVSGTNEKSSPSRRLNDHINFSSGQSSALRYMPQIAENGNESTSPPDVQLENGNGRNDFYVPSFPNDSWNESSLGGLKRSRESEDKFSDFNAMDNENVNSGYPKRLAHHLSLPKTSGEMAAMEKYLQFQQDAVPCKIRAKRGFATHPRSIAERVRRTRISDRMKKLQDLFPNMDKQTNTADMLDLAVEYIKDLQNQVQTLTGNKAKCTCSK